MHTFPKRENILLVSSIIYTYYNATAQANQLLVSHHFLVNTTSSSESVEYTISTVLKDARMHA